MRKRGFTLVEVLMALAVIAVALLVFLSVFSSSGHHAVQSRNRTVAVMLAQTLLDEFEAHPYGEPEPPSWQETTEEPVTVWVQGRKQEMVFHKEITCANGSFVGDSTENQDLITLTITWSEGVGDKLTEGVVAADNKELQVQYPVWR